MHAHVIGPNTMINHLINHQNSQIFEQNEHTDMWNLQEINILHVTIFVYPGIWISITILGPPGKNLHSIEIMLVKLSFGQTTIEYFYHCEKIYK